MLSGMIQRECNEWDIFQRCKQIKEDHRWVVKQLDLMTAGVIFTKLRRPGENISLPTAAGVGEKSPQTLWLRNNRFYIMSPTGLKSRCQKGCSPTGGSVFCSI